MKKRILAVFLAVCLLMCSLSACGGGTTSENNTSSDESTSSSEGTQNDRENKITVGIAQDLDDSLDPYLSTAAGTREVMFNVFEGLVKPDSDGNFIEAVASDVKISPDGLTYTFTLRDGVVFHNGKTCTMDDVLYSLDTCAAVCVNANVVGALSFITEKTVEGNNLVVTLSNPYSDFLSAISSVSIVPKDYTEQNTHPIGTGPFKYVSRSVQENFIIEKHTEYYGEPAGLDQITYKIYEDTTALFTALDSGALDLVAHLTKDQVSNLSNGYDVLEGTMNLVQAIYLNNAAKPFDNELVRQALCYAVDVDAMMDLTADGHGTKVGSSMYPNFGKYFDPALAEAYPHDVEKAKDLLKQAGYADGFSFVIKAPSNYPQHVDAAIVIAEQLKEIGVDAKIEQIDWNTWLSEVYAGRDFQATVVGFDASSLSATAMLARWCSDNGKNLINFNDAEYDQTYAKAQVTVDDEEQTALYRKCLQILSDRAANIYTQDLADFVAIHPDLEGFEFYPLYVIDMAKLHFVD